MEHFARLGMSTGLDLGVDKCPVERHFEHTSRTLDQDDLRVGIGLANLIRQTDGPRTVVSNDAILDRNLHPILLDRTTVR